MKVEFIGLPGVGKTTILNRMNALYEQENLCLIHGCDNLKRSCHLNNILFIFKFFINYPTSLKLLFTSFRWLIAKLSIRNCSNKIDVNRGVGIFKTNGVLMPIISYVVQRNHDNITFDVSKILDILPLPDILIVVTADIKVIIERYSVRGGPRIPDKKSRQKVIVDSVLYNKFDLGYEMVEEITTLLKKKKVKVLLVNNNQVLDDNELKSIMRRVIND